MLLLFPEDWFVNRYVKLTGPYGPDKGHGAGLQAGLDPQTGPICQR